VNPEGAKPLDLLGEKVVTASTREDKRSLKCSGVISATAGGKISVSVDPFQF
jgi:hypothetical protein